MKGFIKPLILLLWPHIAKLLPQGKFLRYMDKRMFMMRLYNQDRNQWRTETLRSQGVKIGSGCLIFSTEFSTEPYLIEIGDHVVISSGTQFITHDGSVWLLREKYPNITVFGRIKIGSNTFIGINCIILPNTTIGSNCIIGAGAVVRGNIPDDSVVLGNPGKIVMKTTMMVKIYLNSKDRVDTKHLNKHSREKLLREHYNI